MGVLMLVPRINQLLLVAAEAAEQLGALQERAATLRLMSKPLTGGSILRPQGVIGWTFHVADVP